MLDRLSKAVLKSHRQKVSHLLSRDVTFPVQVEHVLRIGVLPTDVHRDIQRAIAALREGRVVVTDKPGEGAAGQLHQLDASETAIVPSNSNYVSTLVD